MVRPFTEQNEISLWTSSFVMFAVAWGPITCSYPCQCLPILALKSPIRSTRLALKRVLVHIICVFSWGVGLYDGNLGDLVLGSVGNDAVICWLPSNKHFHFPRRY